MRQNIFYFILNNRAHKTYFYFSKMIMYILVHENTKFYLFFIFFPLLKNRRKTIISRHKLNDFFLRSK